MTVAAYCRVSTDKSDQVHSLESQIRYFEEYARHNPQMKLYKIYADEGISGTSTARRTEFSRMIADAFNGKFELIITKEVSRFSRNILDTISYSRELRAKGIGILFLTDGINTLDADSELRLAIMGSIAQEESRKTSARVKWGQTRQMERGVVFGRSLLGYTATNGKLTVEPSGAFLVERIFSKYVNEQKGTSVIACEMKELADEMGIYRKWTPEYISKILKNEKYAGDLLQKKTYTPDYLTHMKKKNRGEEEQIYIRDHHEPLVDREIWNTAQILLESRNKQKGTAATSTRYAFSGQIRCGVCGCPFVSRNRNGKNGKYKTWVCSSSLKRTDGQKKCKIGVSLRDTEAVEMVRRAIKSLNFDRLKFEKRISSFLGGDRTGDEIISQISDEVNRLLCGERISDSMIKQTVESVTVYSDKHCELKLYGFDDIFRFERANK